MRGLEDLTRFQLEVSDYVATVTMNAPPVNAQDRAFREESIRMFDVLGASLDVRAIVLTGNGRRSRPGRIFRAPRHSR